MMDGSLESVNYLMLKRKEKNERRGSSENERVECGS